MSSRASFYLVDLGQISYFDAMDLQQKLVQHRFEDPSFNVLLVLEHPPVFTLGRRGKRSDILVSDDVLQQEGIEVISTDRGGEVTYHGPGQLVAYIISHVQTLAQDVSEMIYNVEESIIRYLHSRFALPAFRLKGKPGVWTASPPRKIASIGMKLTHGVTSHGLAINLLTKKQHWDMIVACGLREYQMTSVAEEQGISFIDMTKEKHSFALSFSEVFNVSLSPLSLDQLHSLL